MPKFKQIKAKPINKSATKVFLSEARYAAKDMKTDMDSITVGGWSSPLRFKANVEDKGNGDIYLGAYQNKKTNKRAQIFDWVDKGTGLWGPKKKKYKIRPKKKGGVLAFKTPYTAGSVPNSTTTAPARVGSNQVFAAEVTHPGIKSRNWTKIKVKKWKKIMPMYLKKAINLYAMKSGHEYK